MIEVVKRDGSRASLDIEKLHKVVFYACEDINGVSPSEVEIHSQVQFFDGIKTSDVQETLIKSAADLISEESPNYQWVAGRLINYHLRKMVYGQFDPWHLKELVEKNVEKGFYDSQILESYSKAEFNKLNSYIKHQRDDTLTYAAMEQWRGKYLVQNRVTKQIYETPQMAYMLIAMTLFQSYPKDTRIKWVKEYYDAVSTFDISLPTPVMAGVRTPQRQFSSCVLVETGDSLDSINATTSSIVKYVSQKAGIGIGAGSIRALGSPIRSGDAYHTGVIPFYKMFQSATRSCSQGGVRNGAATLYYPIWHLEVEDLLVLKNNKGTEDNRVRHMDYGVQFNKLMYERLLVRWRYYTFFTKRCTWSYTKHSFNDQDQFKYLYEKAEVHPNIRKKSIAAIDLFSQFMEERKNTGRIYLMNVDHANTHSSFIEKVAPVHQSNLCCEIDLPTKPLNSFNDEEGEIALCTLSAINWGKINKPADFQKPCELAVRGLDALLDYQDYPVKAARNATMKRRPLGIGIINLAYWLAKNNTNYEEPNLELLDEYAEAWSFFLIKASADLAKEQVAPSGFTETKYSQGLMPIDTRKKEIDELIPHVERQNWSGLRKDIMEWGIKNSTLMALMPSETSAQIANATNGIEPPRSFVSVKQSKDGVLKQVVPGIHKLRSKYNLLWDQKSPEGYLKICAVLQKYIDQGISVNTSYNPTFFDDEKIPLSTMIQDVLMFYKYGGKQLYYFNTFDGQGEIDIIKLDELPQEQIDDADCESCVL